jgi:hypothetical protein
MTHLRAFLPFTPSSWWVHVAVISLICTDGDQGGRPIWDLRENTSPTVEKKKGDNMTMKKRKWFIPVVVVSVLLIGGIVGGVVAASDNPGNTDDQSQAVGRYQTLLDKVCAIYEENTGVAIDSGQLKDALDQARIEIRDEALESWLQNLVDEGKITQGEADQYLEWWQSRPDVQLPLPRLDRPALGGGKIWGRGFGSWGGPCSLNASAEAGGQ